MPVRFGRYGIPFIYILLPYYIFLYIFLAFYCLSHVVVIISSLRKDNKTDDITVRLYYIPSKGNKSDEMISGVYFVVC